MIKPPTLSARAWVDLLALASIWGASFLAMAIVLKELGFLTTALHRVAWAALLLWLWVFWRRIPIPRDPRIWAACLVMGLLNNALPFSLIAWGQTTIESGLTAILNAATAPFGALAAALFLRDERLTGQRALGVALGVGGVILAIGPGALAGLDLRDLAQLAVLGAAVSYALAGVWARVRLTGLAPEIAAAGMLTGSTLPMLPLAILVERPPSLALSSQTWLAIAYMAGAATAGAYLLYYRVLATAGAANLMLVTLIMPVIAVSLGALVLKEVFAWESLLGFAIIAAGLMIFDGRLLRRH